MTWLMTMMFIVIYNPSYSILHIQIQKAKKKKDRESHTHDDGVVDSNLDDFEILRERIKLKKKSVRTLRVNGVGICGAFIASLHTVV